ncbi:MAG: trypsin-like serine protease [Myxococcaceae bacterium]|jgi:V8-like Glu-specific endopeptidase|nr:trypsin-like serine protease [Myxococcaceae bacterium]
MRLVLVSALLLALAACGPTELAAADEVTVERQRQAIVGGTPAPNETTVFQLIMTEQSGQMGICTATLIGTRTLLTAAHCVDTARSVFAHNAPADNQLQFGVNAYRAARWNVHPGWNPNGQDLRNDIAIILLERAPTNVTPKPWNSQTLTGAFRGRPIRAIGYGNTSPGMGNGTRRQVDLTVVDLYPQLIFMGDQRSKGVCQGDSGGPTFHTFPDGVERVVGVHSFTTSQACTFGADTRTDAFSSFIQQYLAMYEAPSCDRDGRCATNCAMTDYDCVCGKDNICSTVCLMLPGGVDPDCPDCGANGLCATTTCGEPDPDCVAEGQACVRADQCVNRQCRNDPQNLEPYCTRACTGPADCGASFECTGGICIKRQLPTIADQQPCQLGVNVCGMESVCTGQTQVESTCQPTCRNVGDCPERWQCATGWNGFRYCQAPPKPPIYIARAAIAGPVAQPGFGCSSAGGLSLLALGLVVSRRRRGR